MVGTISNSNDIEASKYIDNHKLILVCFHDILDLWCFEYFGGAPTRRNCNEKRMKYILVQNLIK